MPNFDGGHYFLTVLAPIKPGADYDPKSHASRSHRHMLMQALSLMPLSEITGASKVVDTPVSPFARTTCTHLARFVVIDGAAFNGRESGDSLLAKLPFWPFKEGDKLTAQPVDQLTTPYLLFVADFDASNGYDATLESFTDTLWHHMQPELTEVFQHCIDFDENPDAKSFFRYVKRCQIETTMPFNDYWTEPPPLADATRWLLGGLAASVIVAILVGLKVSWLLALLVLAVGIYMIYRLILARGLKPLPAAPNSDLPSVLKALYLQQHFAQFMMDHQGCGDADLHAAFERFLQAHAPSDLDGPATQAPGVIPAARLGAPA
jgi:hypothetical protein